MSPLNHVIHWIEPPRQPTAHTPLRGRTSLQIRGSLAHYIFWTLEMHVPSKLPIDGNWFLMGIWIFWSWVREFTLATTGLLHSVISFGSLCRDGVAEQFAYQLLLVAIRWFLVLISNDALFINFCVPLNSFPLSPKLLKAEICFRFSYRLRVMIPEVQATLAEPR